MSASQTASGDSLACSTVLTMNLPAAQLFMIGTFASLSPAVQATQVELSCGTDAYSWWVLFTYLVSSNPYSFNSPAHCKMPGKSD